MRRLALTTAIAASAALIAVAAGASATAAPAKHAAAPRKAVAKRSVPFQLGVMDDALLGNAPSIAFGALKGLKPKVVRFDAYWPTIAPKRPSNSANPADPAYNWTTIDNVVVGLAAQHIPAMLEIDGTPPWNGTSYKDKLRGNTTYTNSRPKNIGLLQQFAYALATRYSGSYTPPGATAPLPRVTKWEAWNEPNTMTHLWPQYTCNGGPCEVSGPHHTHPIAVAPANYVAILNAIYAGIHSAGNARHVTETVAGGATKPAGNGPYSSEPSIAPIQFLTMMAPKHPHFDVYSHHPYRIGGTDVPSKGGNIGFDGLPLLLQTLDHLFPGKHYHLWITEYGIQTNPPDKLVGVSPAKQAAALAANFATARANPRIDMLIWFLIRDEALHDHILYGGFQTGLAYVNGQIKPSWVTFQRLARQ